MTSIPEAKEKKTAIGVLLLMAFTIQAFSILCLAGIGWAAFLGVQIHHQRAESPRAAQDDRVFVIAPMIQGMGYCNAGASLSSIEEAIYWCIEVGDPGAAEIRATLDKLEPGGASGRVQVGYMLGLNAFDMFSAGSKKYLSMIEKIIADVPRPVVLYFMANHFAGNAKAGMLPKTAFLQFSDQSIPQTQYFHYKNYPWTLDMDPSLEVNRIRFLSLDMLGAWYRNLPDNLKARILAVTLAGELHHFFPGFSTGMGNFDNIRVTDYGPRSTLAFQRWLQEKYINIEALNKVLGTAFVGFDTVIPPSRDLRRDRLESFSQHYDAFAHGLAPVSGWFDIQGERPELLVYVDGNLVGSAEDGLNRQDVYEAVPEVMNARVGFRYGLEFSRLPRGVHVVQLTAKTEKGEFELGRRKIVVMGDRQDPPPVFNGVGKFLRPPREWRYSIDFPRNLQDYYFNPLARLWNDFRSYQVRMAYLAWFNRAVRSGLPGEKLYSHQIAVATIGGWNPVLFASDQSIQGETPYGKGINGYGGSIDMALMRRYYLQRGERFAVPEFHPQAWKDASEPRIALQTFLDGGAVFVSPYFLSIAPDKFRRQGDSHDKFRLAPGNPDYGSDKFYQAIVDLAKD